MRMRIKVLLLGIGFGIAYFGYIYLTHLESHKKFVVLITSYNNRDWYRYNLNSVFAQTYPYYRVIYVDDCSPDGTGELVQEYIQSRQKTDKVTLIKNAQRRGSLANHYTAIHMCQDDEIIVCLDGDDWFADDYVLEYINGMYKDESVWITYGQFCNWPTGQMGWSEEIPQQVVERNAFREYGFVAAQVKTFYAWLAKKIKREDLLVLKDDGTYDFFPIASDVAIMFPMLEMAGRHSLFNPKVLCQRNVATPINDFKVNPELQIQTTKFIASKKPYSPL